LSPIVIEGYAPARDELPAPEYDEVCPDFFTTLGIPILSGRNPNMGWPLANRTDRGTQNPRTKEHGTCLPRGTP
jgi:hypothetical protein